MFSPSGIRKNTTEPLYLSTSSTPQGQAFSPFVLSLRSSDSPVSQHTSPSSKNSSFQTSVPHDQVLHSIETLFRGTYQTDSPSSFPEKNTHSRPPSSKKSLQEQLDTVKKHTISSPQKRSGFFSLWGK